VAAGAAGKNLSAAARHWCEPGGGSGDALEDAAALGVRIDGDLEAGEAVCYVLPENWDVVRAFLAAQTQWRRAGDAGAAVGLDYAGARAAVRALTADGLGREKAGRRLRWRRVFDGLREMEAAAAEELARRRKVSERATSR